MYLDESGDHSLRVVLHTSDLIRNRNGFERMKDPGFRRRFIEALNDAMRRWSTTVVGCAGSS